ncbi:MAG: AzlC family ABC transporter permease [Anaerolineales bacterium]|nr:AzlC family ABC transporter permease [Anaerolineales bacterium]
MNASQPPSRKTEFWNGVKATFPLVVGAIPFGIIYGALAVTSGLSARATLGMSLFVFAGSSQFIAAGLVASGAGVGTIVMTTFIVNLRHALYATTLAPHMKHLSQKWLLPLGFWLTDETFVVTAQRYDQPEASPYKHWFALGSAVFMYTNWQLCTAIGLVAGQAIPDPGSWGLDFAMVVTFIGMLVPMVVNRPVLAAVLVAGASAVLANNLPNQIGLFIAAILGIGAGVAAERVSEK